MIIQFLVVIILSLHVNSYYCYSEEELPWTYKCVNGMCEKTLYTSTSETEEPKVSMAVCRLLCSNERTLWPMVTGRLLLNHEIHRFCLKDIKPTVNMRGHFTSRDLTFVNFHVGEIAKHFISCPANDFRSHHDEIQQPVTGAKPLKQFVREHTMSISVNLTGGYSRGSDLEMSNLNTDESYELRVQIQDNHIQVLIDANNRYGSGHGFATLQQLIVNDPIYKCMATLTEVNIQDFPTHPHRGVMIDTSRNFLSLSNIKVLLDTMAMFKLNTLHFHLTDSHSFPYDTPAQPEMARYGAYRKDYSFTRQQIEELTEYADLRGIRILPEIDIPAHTGFGWQWGEQAGLGKLVLCEGLSPWETFCLQAPCGQLNVVNRNIYGILETIFSDLYNATRSQIFHLGGDEVKFDCWNATEEIVKNLTDSGYDLSAQSYHKLWGNFTLESYDTLRNAYQRSAVYNNSQPNPLAVYWTSTLTTKDYLQSYFDPATSIVMYWENLASGVWVEDILKANLRMIFSNHDTSYMDCGFPHYVNDGNIWCSPYKKWTDIYENDYVQVLRNLGMNPDEYRHLVLGGQTLLWTEVAHDKAFLYKYISRLLASAERWWTYPEPRVTALVRSRIDYHQLNLAQTLGAKVRPDMLTTEWCVQHPSSCYAAA